MKILEQYDAKARKLGMIEAFCEVVAWEVKDLAFSPIMEAEEWEDVKAAAQAIAEHFEVFSFVETDLMSSDLVPDEAVKGKVVVLYYKKPETLEKYLSLKASVMAQEEEGSYTAEARKSASIALRRLLSYSEHAINEHYTA